MNKKEILIHHYLNQLKEKSKCIDKQVACVITDASYEIISTGINRVIFCDQNCDDKINRRCFTVHAEIIAIAKHKPPSVCLILLIIAFFLKLGNSHLFLFVFVCFILPPLNFLS